jgi:hypothetical protein
MLVEQSEQASFKRTSSKIHRNVRKIRAMTKYYVIPKPDEPEPNR